jgi:glucose/arabinose dehydrogenase
MAARFYRRSCLIAALLLPACGRTPPPTPSPPTTDPGETISGRERLGWDQQAGSTVELGSFRYAIYVDGVRSELADVTCGTAAGVNGFACSGRLPALSNGAHTLELVAFVLDGADRLESARSAPLRVTVTALTAPVPEAAPLASGDVITTADHVRLRASLLAADLQDVVDLALLPDGRMLIAERSGFRLLPPRRPPSAGALPLSDLRAPSTDGDVAAMCADADFARSGFVFVVHTSPDGFRLVRYRLVEGALTDRIQLMRAVAASAEAAAALRFGPDGDLYIAFDDGGSREMAARASEWNGKILRLKPDGGTPDDQPAASPVYWSGLRAPRGLAWSPDGTLWLAEQRADRVDRVLALGIESPRPRRAVRRASYPLPQPFGARTLAFHPGGDLTEFRHDLLIAANDAGYVLRIRFDAADAQRVIASERLLEGRIGPVRAVTTASDGSIYVASDAALWQLSRSR